MPPRWRQAQQLEIAARSGAQGSLEPDTGDNRGQQQRTTTGRRDRDRRTERKGTTQGRKEAGNRNQNNKAHKQEEGKETEGNGRTMKERQEWKGKETEGNGRTRKGRQQKGTVGPGRE